MKKGPVLTIVAGIVVLICAITLWAAGSMYQPSPGGKSQTTTAVGTAAPSAPQIPTGPDFSATDGIVQAADKFLVGSDRWKIPAPDAAGQGLDKYYAQTVDWGPCQPFGLDVSEDLEGRMTCGWLLVPADYQRPDGPTLAIAVSQVLAGNGNQNAPHLVVNPGGPGYSGLQLAADMADNDYVDPSVRENFSVVGFAPRGVGESLPPIRCVGSTTWHTLVADNTGVSSDGVDTDDGPNGAGSIRQNIERDFGNYFAQRCNEFTAQGFAGIEASDVISHSSTADVARDLDILRAVLGDDGLTYLGYSYGTAIGQEYSQQFPGKIRALVLDGNVDPGWTNPDLYSQFSAVYLVGHSPSSIEQGTAKAINVQSAQRFAAACMGGKLEPSVQEPCVLTGSSPADALDRLAQELADAEISNPQTQESVHLGYEGAIAVIGMIAKDPDNWGTLNTALVELKETGRSEWIDEAFGEESEDEVEGNFSGAPTFAFDAYAVVTCSDYPLALRPPYCSGLDVAGQLSPVAHAAADVLVVDSVFDPQTPFSWGVVAGRVLGAQILSVASTDHGISFSGVQCLDNAVSSFLMAPGDVVLEDSGRDVEEQKDQFSRIGAGKECQLL